MAASVTAIVPTYERAALVARALESIYAQTRPPDEVIVVDDGSTDGTAELVRERFPAALLIQQNNAGVSAARNAGVARASGDWIALLDSDDEWLPRKIERQLAALERDPHPLCHTEEIWIRRGRRVNPMKKHAKQGGRIYRRCLPLCVISPSSALLSRALLEEVGTFDADLPVCEDYDLWLRVCARHPVLFLPEPLIVKHGGHADQLSRSTPGMDRYRIVALEKMLESGPLSPEDREATRRELLAKIAIYAGGARKRGRLAEAEEYERRRERWAGA